MAAGGLADSASTRKGDGMAGGPPAAVRPAATVVLHRPGASGLEVFWVRRGGGPRFAGGVYPLSPGGGGGAGAPPPPPDAQGLPPLEGGRPPPPAPRAFREAGG